MTKKRELDSELENLLRAFREVHPTASEKEGWRGAIAAELVARKSAEDLRGPIAAPESAKPAATAGARVYRFLVRAAIPVGVAASLGFAIGAYVVEKRYGAGEAMLFSQIEPAAMKIRPPTTMDEAREVVRVNLDEGVNP